MSELEELTEVLPTLAAAPNGIRTLRRLLYELAAQGRLLDRGQGPPPEAWPRPRLAEIAAFSGGKTPSMANPNYWDGAVPWVTPKDMKADTIVSAQMGVSRLAVKECGLALVPEGAVLIVVRSGILRHSLPVALTEVPVTINQDLKALRPSGEVSGRFLQALLRGYESRIIRELTKTGTTVESLRFDDFADARYPLPAPYLQDKILSRLDELLASLDEVAEAKSRRDRVRTAAMRSIAGALTRALEDADTKAIARWADVLPSVFGDSTDAPLLHQLALTAAFGAATRRAARSVALADACVTIFTGPFGTSLRKSDYVPGGTPVINPQNIANGGIEITPDTCVGEETLERLAGFRVRTGDVVLARRGEMGRCAVVTAREHGWLCGTGSMVLRPKPGLLPEYLALFIRTPAIVNRLRGESVGSTMMNLNQRILTSLRIPVLTIASQQAAVSKEAELRRRATEIAATADHIVNLRQTFAARIALIASD